MKKTWWLLLVMACAHAPQRVPETVERVEVFTEAGGTRVELLHLGGNKCVLHVTGSNTELDGIAFACTRSETDRAIIFAIERDGFSSQTLQIRNRTAVELFPPWRRDGIKVALDAAAGARFDPAPLLAKHHQQQDSGQLARLAKFDRPRHLAGHQGSLADEIKEATNACSVTFAAEFDWDTLTDDEVRSGAWSSTCGGMFEHLARLCRSPSGKDFVVRHVSRVRCDRGSSPDTRVKLDGKTLIATLGTDAIPEEFLRRAFADVGATPDAPPVPWGDGKSLRNRLVLDEVAVCTNAQGQFIASTVDVGFPDADRAAPKLFVGDRDTVSAVKNDRRFPHFFIDARQLRKTELHPTVLEQLGVPGKFVSEVRIDRRRGECDVRCGERVVKLSVLSTEEVHRVLPAHRLTPGFTRKPHALLRDRAGSYYYVDTSTESGREKDFRVWVGPRGKMKALQLVNSLSDSEGDLFTTKNGELRLSLDRSAPSFWMEGKKKVELKGVPVNENLDVIFVELGVYTGARLGTPCDDF